MQMGLASHQADHGALWASELGGVGGGSRRMCWVSNGIAVAGDGRALPRRGMYSAPLRRLGGGCESPLDDDEGERGDGGAIVG